MKKNRKKAFKPKVKQIKGMLFSIFGSLKDEDMHGLVEDKIYPETGGILTKLVGCSYYYKGYPDRRVMSLLDFTKDASWMIVSIFEDKATLALNALRFIFSKKYFKKVMESYLRMAYQPLWKNKFIPEDGKIYCPAVKELYRASEVVLDKIKNDYIKTLATKLRDIALMIIEYDTAYRFVAQDVLPEIDTGKLRKNASKEIQRVLNILIEREIPGDQRDKWISIKKKIAPILKIWVVKRWVISFFEEVDFSKVKLDEADWYFCLRRHCYSFRGVSIEDRLKEKDRIDKERGHNLPKFKFVKNPDLSSKQLVVNQ
jgi:hypothetical protein